MGNRVLLGISLGVNILLILINSKISRELREYEAKDDYNASLAPYKVEGI